MTCIELRNGVKKSVMTSRVRHIERGSVSVNYVICDCLVTSAINVPTLRPVLLLLPLHTHPVFARSSQHAGVR